MRFGKIKKIKDNRDDDDDDNDIKLNQFSIHEYTFETKNGDYD